MKLFNSTEVISKREAISNAETRRLETVSKELLNKRQQLQALELDFEVAINLQSEKWESSLAEWAKKKLDLEREVIRLEERRKQNLFPLEAKFEKVEDMSKKLAIREAKFNKKEEEFEERAELLQEKLSAVAERESEADRLSKLQLLAEQGIASQRAQIALQAKEMSKSIESSLNDISIKGALLSRRETSNSLKEKALVDKEKELAKIEAGFSERERGIQDRYATLERAIKQQSDRNTPRP